MPIPRLLGVVAAAAAAASLACGRPEPADWTIDVQPVPLPAGPDSLEPQVTTSSRGVLLSWIERAGTTATLKFVERTASGWTDPITVTSGDNWFLSYADMPSVLRFSDGTLVAQWLERTHELIDAYDLHISYSRDDGRSWAPSFLPHDDGTTSQHGFASMVELPGERLGIVWLDGRNSEFDFDDPESGTMMLRFAEFDADWNRLSDTLIDRRVCECCPTSAVLTDDGLLTAYRGRSESEVRDVLVSRFEDGTWTPPAPISRDGWTIEFCPVNGPMLSARDRQVVATWFTVKNDEGHAYAAFSDDAGRSWGAPIRLDETMSLGRVGVVLLDDGSAVATWLEYAGGRTEFRARLVDAAGATSAPVTIAGIAGSRPNGYPRIARHGDELIFAWTESAEGEEEETAFTVKAAVAALP